MAETLVFVFCSLVFCVCDVNYKNKVIKVLPAFMLSVIITMTKRKKQMQNIFLYFFLRCFKDLFKARYTMLSVSSGFCSDVQQIPPANLTFMLY